MGCTRTPQLHNMGRESLTLMQEVQIFFTRLKTRPKSIRNTQHKPKYIQAEVQKEKKNVYRYFV